MYVIRDVFRCKPGKSGALAEKFKNMSKALGKEKLPLNARILVDAVASYWTVVFEFEIESLAKFDKQMEEYRSRPGVKKAMEGYMELVREGHREIFRVA